jgi:hypothetical protein
MTVPFDPSGSFVIFVHEVPAQFRTLSPMPPVLAT